jgi:uncharacterized protein YyaL (SSP411 family)
VLHIPAGAAATPPPSLGAARGALLARREQRVRPGLDDKRLCSWNALMISALADAGAAMGREDYLDAARECARFIAEDLHDEQGRLLRTWKDGRGRLNAYLEDHAFLLEGLLALYEATLEQRWFEAARETADAMIERFADPDLGGFFTTSGDHEQLIARRKDLADHPIPSGNSSAALGLLRLAALTGEQTYEEHAVAVLRLLTKAAVSHPDAFGHFLLALDFHLSPTHEVALVGPAEGADDDLRKELSALGEAVWSRLHPHLVLAGGREGTDTPELLRDRIAVDGAPAAYVCERFACKAPVTAPAELEASLRRS